MKVGDKKLLEDFVCKVNKANIANKDLREVNNTTRKCTFLKNC